MHGGQPCDQCGVGPGMGSQPGQGRGGLAKDEPTAVGFKTERGKVATQKGAIIGQTLVKGEQFKGDVNSTAVELLTAGEHDASDRINRNRVPRQYQNAIKAYFSSTPRPLANVKRTDSAEGGKDQPAGQPEPAKPDKP